MWVGCRAYTKGFGLIRSVEPVGSLFNSFVGAVLMKTSFFLLPAILACARFAYAAADEGMWLFNAFPKEKVKAKYGFEPSQQWLDHVRLSSVRFNNGGSGSFVSPDGLTFTNHHVGAVCVHQLSTHGHDYIKEGFYAKTQAEEAKCPDLELNELVGIEDVTSQDQGCGEAWYVVGGSRASTAGRDVDISRRNALASTGLRCDVVTFYSGEVYNLYKYKKYTDVRLVFAPEFDIAFFGGDPDNFTYPRYDLDITFFRVYENEQACAHRALLALVPNRREGERTDLCFRASGIDGAAENHGPARIPARRRLSLASGNLQAPHRPASEFRQRVGRKCPHREGRAVRLSEFVQGALRATWNP